MGVTKLLGGARQAVGLGNIIPTSLTSAVATKGKGGYIAAVTVLDLLYRDWCVFLQTPSLLMGGNESSTGLGLGGLIDTTGLPLIGFTFQQPSNFEILKYQFTKFPLLNKAVVANSMIKESTKITLTGLRPITASNPIILNIALNNVGLKLIEKYADMGGLWWINTMWGARFNYVLTDLKGTMPVDDIGGVGWEFTFERLNFDSVSSATKSVDSKVSLLSK